MVMTVQPKILVIIVLDNLFQLMKLAKHASLSLFLQFGIFIIKMFHVESIIKILDYFFKFDCYVYTNT